MNKHKLSVYKLIEDDKANHIQDVTVKGYLKITEMLSKALYFKPRDDLFIDLRVSLENLPDLPNNEKYIPGEFYCVIVDGSYQRYSKDFLIFNSLSNNGVLNVHNLSLCKTE